MHKNKSVTAGKGKTLRSMALYSSVRMVCAMQNNKIKKKKQYMCTYVCT